MNDEAAYRTAMSVALAAGVAVAIVSGLIASSGEVAGWEASIFHAINDLPDWLEQPMWLFQLAGLLFVPLVVAAVAAHFRKWWLVAGLVALVPLKLIVEKAVVKQLVERERPGTTICGYPDDFDETCGNFRDVPLEGLSFVSGHAIIAWGVAALLWPVLPGRWRWLPIRVCRSCPATPSSPGAWPRCCGPCCPVVGVGSRSRSQRSTRSLGCTSAPTIHWT